MAIYDKVVAASRAHLERNDSLARVVDLWMMKNQKVNVSAINCDVFSHDDFMKILLHKP